MRALLPLLLLGLAGCYTPGTASPGPGGPYSAAQYGGAWYGEPLRASVWFDEYTGFASFDLNRPAHVAMFTLYPGGGMNMIYPAIGVGREQQFRGGRHHVRTAAAGSYVANRYTYGYNDGYGYDYGYGYGGNGLTPTYLILIASERPLDIRSFMTTGSVPWLSRLSATWNPYTATEILASQIVPQPSVTDWTVAYHVMWPRGWDAPAYRPRYALVECPGNVILSVPIEALRRGLVRCPTGEMPPSDGTRDLPTIGDKVARRPVPRGWMGPAEADETRLRETLRRVAEKRGLPADSVRMAMPSWRRVAGRRPDGVPGVGDEVSPRARESGRTVVPTRPGQGEAQPASPAPVPIRVEGPRRPRPAPAQQGGVERPSRPQPTPGQGEVERPSRPQPAPAPSRVERPSRPEPTPAPSRVERPSRPTPSRVERPSRPAPQPKVERPSRPAPRPRPERPKPRPKPNEGGGGGGSGGGGS